MKMMHLHHVVPRHAGGENGPTVLVTLEEHTEAHRLLWEQHGRWQDYVAWKALSGHIPYKEARRLAMVEGGKYASKLHKGMKRSEESRQRMSKSAKQKRGGMAHLRDPQMRKSVGEKNRGKKRSQETRKNISRGAKRSWKRWRQGHPHSLESRRRISEARKNMPRNKSKICSFCNRGFFAQVSTAMYCSGSCKTRAWKIRQT